MGQTEQGSFFAPDSHTSYLGALKGDQRRAAKTKRYLLLLLHRGPLTDWEAAHALVCERTSINSIRNGLMPHFVTKGFMTRSGSDGATPNATWQLTKAGSAAARALEE